MIVEYYMTRTIIVSSFLPIISRKKSNQLYTNANNSHDVFLLHWSSWQDLNLRDSPSDKNILMPLICWCIQSRYQVVLPGAEKRLPLITTPLAVLTKHFVALLWTYCQSSWSLIIDTLLLLKLLLLHMLRPLILLNVLGNRNSQSHSLFVENGVLGWQPPTLKQLFTTAVTFKANIKMASLVHGRDIQKQ